MWTTVTLSLELAGFRAAGALLRSGGMAGVRSFEDLIAYQLSVRLRDEVYRLTRSGKAARDVRFTGQIRDSSSGPPRTIAEGFGRFRPREFAQFLNYAVASHHETQNHLKHGRTEKYFSEDEFQATWRLACRALSATMGLMKYLRSCPRNAPFDTAAP